MSPQPSTRRRSIVTAVVVGLGWASYYDLVLHHRIGSFLWHVFQMIILLFVSRMTFDYYAFRNRIQPVVSIAPDRDEGLPACKAIDI